MKKTLGLMTLFLALGAVTGSAQAQKKPTIGIYCWSRVL